MLHAIACVCVRVCVCLSLAPCVCLSMCLCCYMYVPQVKYQVGQDYMSKQAQVNYKMRAILIDWLIQVHLRFTLLQETLYLTISIIDRYLQVSVTCIDSVYICVSTVCCVGLKVVCVCVCGVCCVRACVRVKSRHYSLLLLVYSKT